jgi:hypothetical protein
VAGADHPQSDFRAIGDENALKHRSQGSGVRGQGSVRNPSSPTPDS